MPSGGFDVEEPSNGSDREDEGNFAGSDSGAEERRQSDSGGDQPSFVWESDKPNKPDDEKNRKKKQKDLFKEIPLDNSDVDTEKGGAFVGSDSMADSRKGSDSGGQPPLLEEGEGNSDSSEGALLNRLEKVRVNFGGDVDDGKAVVTKTITRVVGKLGGSVTENGDGTLTVTLSPNANTEATVDILSSFGAVESIGVEQLRIEEIDEAAANQVANSRDANGESDSSTTALVAIFGAPGGGTRATAPTACSQRASAYRDGAPPASGRGAGAVATTRSPRDGARRTPFRVHAGLKSGDNASCRCLSDSGRRDLPRHASCVSWRLGILSATGLNGTIT